jgi:hypothetical protein
VKALERGSEIRDEESIVEWFYHVLRNAVIDHYRKRSARARAHEGFLAESPEVYEPEFRNTVCQCIWDVLDDLKPEYRDVIATSNSARRRLRRSRSLKTSLRTMCQCVCTEPENRSPSILRLFAVLARSTNA